MQLTNRTNPGLNTVEQAYSWSEGRAIFTGGSPFNPVEYNGKVHVSGWQGQQCIHFSQIWYGFDTLINPCAIRVHDETLLAAYSKLINIHGGFCFFVILHGRRSNLGILFA